MVVLNVFKVHRNPKFWGDDAENFEPERFEPEKIKNVHPYAYLPFAGKRICIIFKMKWNFF